MSLGQGRAAKESGFDQVILDKDGVLQTEKEQFDKVLNLSVSAYSRYILLVRQMMVLSVLVAC